MKNAYLRGFLKMESKDKETEILRKNELTIEISHLDNYCTF